MQLTPEQQSILAYNNDMKINAVAGSGKTTTLIQYAKTRPSNARILYLAFNKSVRLEAEKRFAAEGLYNVKVETAHSLAFKSVMRERKYELKSNGYSIYEIKEILQLKGIKDPNTIYILANHISRFVSYFCNSTARRVKEINYLDIILDEKAKKFVTNFYDRIFDGTRLFLAKMYKGEIPITHDFYLKQFQLANPTLPYHYLLFDEGQDASAVMLDVFLKQQGTKIIVGDTHQQIYGWRHAVNSLAQVDFPTFQLTNSFRFDPEIAVLAMKYLGWKKLFTDYKPMYITGKGTNNTTNSRATLARTNLGLLTKAIDLVFDQEEVDKLYFEGNINSYTYAEEGASIYDVLNLYLGQNRRIRNELLQSMNDFTDLEEYVEGTGDVEMKMLMEVVSKYKRKLPFLLKKLKDYHVEDGQKEQADMIFSTVHRCKGMEYDEVILKDDFMNEARLRKTLSEQGTKVDKARLIEEINLLYVAVTRTKNKLVIPNSLQPVGSKISWTTPPLKNKPIFDFSTHEPTRKKEDIFTINATDTYYEKLRKRKQQTTDFWTRTEEKKLRQLFTTGKSMQVIATYFDRTKSEVYRKLMAMKLVS